MGKIDKRRLLSLFVFFSRKNQGKELIQLLRREIFDTKNKKDLSSRIFNVFITFIKSKDGSVFLSDFIKKQKENSFGKSLWNIYKSDYLSKERKTNNIFSKQFKDSQMNLTYDIIVKRLNEWLTTELPDRTITSYIFDIYSDYEREIIMKENEVCKEIANLTKSLSKYPIPNLTISKQFIMDNMDSNDFLQENGPQITKSTQKNRRTDFFQGKIIGGRKTRKNYK
jgi:hypothetical protein